MEAAQDRASRMSTHRDSRWRQAACQCSAHSGLHNMLEVRSS